MHLESFQDLFLVDTLAHEVSSLVVLYLLSQEIAECARHNLEVTMQLINKYINLTHLTPHDRCHPHGWQQLASCHYVGTQINVGPLY